MGLFDFFRRKKSYKATQNTASEPGFYKGKHYTEYVDVVKELKREKRNRDAISLLLKLIDAMEQESVIKDWAPAPWYYEQLAILYRKEKQGDKEIAILKRYFSACKNHNEEPSPRLVERYNKF